ncbi:DUF3995 domain-containing protein [Kitasatospora aureofaciens]|uniref:DUF3995 domain-containing protein n=1 Tax=Kitasatospora aureofaciens TaxID=1894 RepID=A0A1E7MZ52_KITAU|nr:DUF3995 domain-containing protein [Kitasatospora aureofaciens]ARF80606.1 hypothetical protein B6264_18355 [Kitasatospora aureofaciens]OEV33503.1 hypothetical protein HS99_0013135 [Kitasatospora aureofaciens]GGU60530.1 hypothetical protein GCM10010502_08760 [Kitasatospora aureofaciens]
MAGAVRVVGGAVSAALAVTGALHAVWAVTPWPLRTPEEFADAVVGTGRGVPPAGACLAVAGALGAASYLVGAEAGVLPAVGSPGLRRSGVRVAAGVLLARGVAGPVVFGRVGERTERFRRLNVRYYSPLCVALGVGAAAVGWRGPSATNC